MAGPEERAELWDKEEEEERLLEGVATLDFDMLCSMVAMQTEGKRRALDADDFTDAGGEYGGVFRMWEGDVLDCFDDRGIAIETACCPCYRFGKNMDRSGLGHWFIQGSVYFSFLAAMIINFVAFAFTRNHTFLYMGFGFAFSFGAYLGFFRRQIQAKFNIKDNDSSWDGFIFHLLCPFCTLCQESRTLEMNNVRDGVWFGRTDSMCISSSSSSHGEAIFHHHHHHLHLHPPAIVISNL